MYSKLVSSCVTLPRATLMYTHRNTMAHIWTTNPPKPPRKIRQNQIGHLSILSVWRLTDGLAASASGFGLDQLIYSQFPSSDAMVHSWSRGENHFRFPCVDAPGQHCVNFFLQIIYIHTYYICFFSIYCRFFHLLLLHVSLSLLYLGFLFW